MNRKLNEHFPLIGVGHIIGLFIQVCLGKSTLGRAEQGRAAQLTAISLLQTAPSCPLQSMLQCKMLPKAEGSVIVASPEA